MAKINTRPGLISAPAAPEPAAPSAPKPAAPAAPASGSKKKK